jgi:hypothetical protein
MVVSFHGLGVDVQAPAHAGKRAADRDLNPPAPPCNTGPWLRPGEQVEIEARQHVLPADAGADPVLIDRGNLGGYQTRGLRRHPRPEKARLDRILGFVRGQIRRELLEESRFARA